jgi:hypothetical protein
MNTKIQYVIYKVWKVVGWGETVFKFDSLEDAKERLAYFQKNWPDSQFKIMKQTIVSEDI